LKQTILHIGLEKTGTTSIQFLLRENRQQLLKSSVLVSKSSQSGNNFHLAIASYSKFREDGLTRQLGLTSAADLQNFRKETIRALADEIRTESAEKVILSSEHFQSRLLGVEDIGSLKSLLEEAGCQNFKVVVYLRDPLKIVMSHHGMAIKKGIHVTSDFYRPQHPRVSHIIDHKKTLDNWAEVFGRENIDARLYPEGQGGDVLITDFLKAVEIEPGQLDLSKQELRNVNLTDLALETLNDLNAKSDRVRVLAEDRWLFNRLEEALPGRGLNPSSEVVELFANHFKANHREVARQWFDSAEPLFSAEFKPPAEQDGAEQSTAERKRVAEVVEKLIARAMLRRRIMALPRRARRSVAAVFRR
jgi:hypothetical protein